MIIVDVTGDKIEIRSGDCATGPQTVEILFTNNQQSGSGKPSESQGVPVPLQREAIAVAGRLRLSELYDRLDKMMDEKQTLAQKVVEAGNEQSILLNRARVAEGATRRAEIALSELGPNLDNWRKRAEAAEKALVNKSF